MSERWKLSDPQAQKEASRYDNPIPSRQYIMEFIERYQKPISHACLCKQLEIKSSNQKEALLFRLKAMLRDHQLVKNKKGDFLLIDPNSIITGRVQGHREGYGFFIPDDGSNDLYLSVKEMRQVFDGDVVRARHCGVDRRGRQEGVIYEVTIHNTQELVGRYTQEDNIAYLIPEKSKMHHKVILQPGAISALENQYILVEIIKQPTKHALPVGIIKKILGYRRDPKIETTIALHTYSIPYKWSEDVLKLIKTYRAEVVEIDKKNRIDMRHIPFITIDGDDAKDFDDAVYCEKKPSGGWRLFVAIADVSHYVKSDSILDSAAQERATSVYFPGRVIPMLPEVLSNGLCSLNPKVDRLVLVCKISVSALGKVSRYQFCEAVISSHARLTYTQANAMLIDTTKQQEISQSLRDQYHVITPCLDQLYLLYKSLKQVRDHRGAINFETVETRIIFNEQHKIDRIIPTERNEAHKLIEECMLCANVAAANFLEKHKLPGLYRIHEGPSAQKRIQLETSLATLGLSLPANKITTTDFQRLLTTVRKRHDAHIIQRILLRSMSQAIYSENNIGHFGLAYKAYTHFTSPIRRYPDLLTHRAIKSVIHSDLITPNVLRADSTPSVFFYSYSLEQIQSFGISCSIAERRADDATRDATDSLKCDYMLQHIGKKFKGIIVTVTGFGLFIELQDIFVEGLIHISQLTGDYYHFDPARLYLKGEKTGKCYRLGDAIEIIVANVNMETKCIDFELIVNNSNKKIPLNKKKAMGVKKKPASKTTTGRNKNKALKKKNKNKKQKKTK